MENLFSYYEGSLSSLIDDACNDSGNLVKIVFCKVSKALITELERRGVKIDSSYNHVLDNSAVRHIKKLHGNTDEELRGQKAVTKEHLLLLPDIITHYTSVSVGKNKRNQDVIIYAKTMNDYVVFCIEEVRSGRKELAVSTLYIKKKGKLTDADS